MRLYRPTSQARRLFRNAAARKIRQCIGCRLPAHIRMAQNGKTNEGHRQACRRFSPPLSAVSAFLPQMLRRFADKLIL